MTSAGVNVDYSLMGGQWDNSKPISFSIAPDGVAWDGGINNINATLNAQFAGGDWDRLVATALQTWAVSADLNFVPAADSFAAFNASGQAQGDPQFGDIRVGGYAFTGGNQIALTYGPPPNGATAAGDVKLNTSDTFGPTGQYDLETVLIHELGHSLGLGESPQTASLMYSYYSGVRHDLSSDDVEGIQSIYGPRVADQYQAEGQATSAAAVDLSGSLNSSGVAVVNGLSLSSEGDSEYFAVTAPSTQGATLRVSVVANGHSLMSPKVTVIDPSTGAVLAVDTHPDQYGDTASVAVPNAQAGHRYLIVVTGATSDVFSVGDYALAVAFAGGTPVTPVATTPSTPVATTTPVGSTTTTPAPFAAAPVATTAPTTTGGATVAPAPTTTTMTADPYAANTSFGSAAELGGISGLTMVPNVTLRSGQDLRVFTFETTTPGMMFVASAHDTIVIGNAAGQTVTSGQGLIGFQAPVAGSRYYVIVMSADNGPVSDASFSMQLVPMAVATPTPATPVATTVTVGQAVPVGSSTSTSTKAAKHKKRHH